MITTIVPSYSKKKKKLNYIAMNNIFKIAPMRNTFTRFSLAGLGLGNEAL